MFELQLVCHAQHLDPLCDALDDLSAMSVSIEDADALTDAEQPLFGEPGLSSPQDVWQHSRVLALFDSRALAEDALAGLAQQDFFAQCLVAGLVSVPDQDWVRLTQSQFAPVDITPDFWIVPSWHTPPPQARVVIHLDPGLAFGTGTHPSTRMCLRWIAGHAAADGTDGAGGLGRVLDYGCGSGILAIAAAKLGACDVTAVDIDPTAVDAALANAQVNHVQLRCGLPDLTHGVHQTVLANILATPLKVLAPLLCSYVMPGGSLVLSGILARQADELQSAYAPYCALNVTDREDGWILMVAQHPRSKPCSKR